MTNCPKLRLAITLMVFTLFIWLYLVYLLLSEGFPLQLCWCTSDQIPGVPALKPTWSSWRLLDNYLGTGDSSGMSPSNLSSSALGFHIWHFFVWEGHWPMTANRKLKKKINWSTRLKKEISMEDEAIISNDICTSITCYSSSIQKQFTSQPCVNSSVSSSVHDGGLTWWVFLGWLSE